MKFIAESKYCLILSTAPDQATAERIARHLVEKQLAACVNLLPNMVSVYRWKGEVEQASEVMMLIKTESAMSDAVLRELRTVHPYETPEAIVVRIQDGLENYLRWISGAVQPDS
jgi:periplasmic divalent cation tolerance protein